MAETDMMMMDVTMTATAIVIIFIFFFNSSSVISESCFCATLAEFVYMNVWMIVIEILNSKLSEVMI